MVWETVKKEMTITRIFLVIVAILLCCFLAIGLTQKSEKNPANNEKGLEMLNNLFQEYLEKNDTHSEIPQRVHNATRTINPKPRKFYSVAPPVEKSKSESLTTKHHTLDVGNSKHIPLLDHSTNASKNESKPKLDLLLVIDANKRPEPEHEGSKLLDVKNTDTKHVDEVMLNHVLFSKTVRTSKVEEVFEDIAAQNVRRIIKEDRIERIEVSKNKELEKIGENFGIKDLFSL